MSRVLVSGIVLLWAALGCASPSWPAGGRWVDLTHDFADDTIVWPTSDPFELEVLSEGYTDKGYYYAANRFRCAEHGGTHVDAPIHFFEGRATLDEIPLERLIAPAVVVDVSQVAGRAPDYQVTVADLRAFEVEHGPIPEGAIVLLNTGYARRWPDAERYMGTAERGADAVPMLHFPGLAPEAARWLATRRRIGAVGLDTPSIDYGQSTHFESHVILFEHDVPAFENVARLDELPPVGAVVVALPMKIRGGTGGPLRIVAWVGEG